MMLSGRARFIPFSLGAGILLWTLWYLTSPFQYVDPFLHGDHPPHPPPGPPPHHKPPFHHATDATDIHPLPLPPQPPILWTSRAEQVKGAFLHAYHGYQQYAFEHDELLPLTNRSVDNLNGWRLTLVDALDTMWIMDLRTEFAQALPVIANMTFHQEPHASAPFFETVIRYLGGLLSAYALSGDPILLSRADDLGKMLLPAFNTSSGLPIYAVNTVTGATRMGWTFGAVLLSESLTCQLEYKYLAHLTGRRQYFDNVEKIMDIMRDANVTDGMFPTRWNLGDAKPNNARFSVGAFADSAHEYFLKQWLLTSKSETKAKDLYLKSVNAILNNLLYLSPTRHLLYVTDVERNIPSRTFEHLSCFLPGLLTLGATTLPLTPEEKQLHSWAAQGLAHTCWIMYADQPTGLGPDEVTFDRWTDVVHEASDDDDENPPSLDYIQGRWMEHLEYWEAHGKPGGVPPGLREAPPVTSTTEKRDYMYRRNDYLLRPETVESLYYMWRTTGEEKWREHGWKVFEAIEEITKTPSGYTSITTVNQIPPIKKNDMPSFFLAETLKYLYLLFKDEEIIPLDHWVFNTEAHPLPIFEWTEWEKQQYGII